MSVIRAWKRESSHLSRGHASSALMSRLHSFPPRFFSFLFPFTLSWSNNGPIIVKPLQAVTVIHGRANTLHLATTRFKRRGPKKAFRSEDVLKPGVSRRFPRAGLCDGDPEPAPAGPVRFQTPLSCFRAGLRPVGAASALRVCGLSFHGALIWRR